MPVIMSHFTSLSVESIAQFASYPTSAFKTHDPRPKPSQTHMLPPLHSVSAVLQHHPNAGALHQMESLVSSFMGPSPYLSLSEACKLQSLALLDRIWASSCTLVAARSPHWTLGNFLRSDPFYKRWQFAAGVKVAVEQDNVAMLQWLFAHFQGCVVPSDVAELAAQKGNLQLVQVLLANDSKELQGNKVQWGGNCVQLALTNRQLEAAHWLYSNIPLDGMSEEQLIWTIKAAMDVGDLDFCQSIIPTGRCILDYAEYASHPDMVEWKLQCGYFKREALDAVVAIRDLAIIGRLDLMETVSTELQDVQEGLEWPGEWQDALNDVCQAGKLPVVKWLVEHRIGRHTINVLKSGKHLPKLLTSAAHKGHIDVMEYLYEQGAVTTFTDALIKAIEMDQIEAVNWLVEHFPPTEPIPDYCLLDEAARRGRVEILNFFQSLGPQSVPGFFQTVTATTADSSSELEAARNEQEEPLQVVVTKADHHRKVIPNAYVFRMVWEPTDPMDDAAANGQLETVKWLNDNRTEGCTVSAMDAAAANGYLDVVKWLHIHRSEGCSVNAMDFAASNGQLDVVKWLHENTTAGCTSAAMDLSADGGHLEMLMWLKSNRSEGCTAKAGENALKKGHLKVACWLLDHFPQHAPGKIGLLSSSVVFDVLLFLHARFPGHLTPNFVRGVRSAITTQRFLSSDAEILNWLAVNYPAPLMPQRQQFEGLADRIRGDFAQQIAGQLGAGIPDEQQRIDLQNNVMAMMMNNIMVVVHDGDEGLEDDEDMNGDA